MVHPPPFKIILCFLVAVPSTTFRGFTPQAEIWNGRLAMLGLSISLATLLIVRMFNNAA